MPKGKKFFVNYFVSQRNVLAENVPLILRAGMGRVSCNLQRAVAQSILNRIDGREFPDNVADA
jgi:hypothetical protein